MKATCLYGKRDVVVEEVPEPQILSARDAIVRVTSTAICGSDLHLYDGFMPTLQKGDVLGHEYEFDPSFVVTHRLPLSDAARGYELFHDKADQCEKVVLKSAA